MLQHVEACDEREFVCPEFRIRKPLSVWAGRAKLREQIIVNRSWAPHGRLRDRPRAAHWIQANPSLDAAPEKVARLKPFAEKSNILILSQLNPAARCRKRGQKRRTVRKRVLGLWCKEEFLYGEKGLLCGKYERHEIAHKKAAIARL